jgi:two-component system, NarL family, nitrate/nitrite response regulator NarL
MSSLPRRPPDGEIYARSRVSDPPFHVLFVTPDRLGAETLRVALRRVEIRVEIVSPGHTEVTWRAEHRPDLVLIELGINGAGLELAEGFLELDPSAKLVALLPSLNPRLLEAVNGAGFFGYMSKNTPLSTFVHGLRHSLAGRPVRSPSRPEPIRRRRPVDPLGDQLTPREREVVTLVAGGSGNEQIGLRLRISPNTVRTHVQNALSKLQLHSRVEIAAWAFRNGLVGQGVPGPVSPPVTAGSPGIS